MTTPTDPAPPEPIDNGPRPEDGDQSTVSQDPNDDYSGISP